MKPPPSLVFSGLGFSFPISQLLQIVKTNSSNHLHNSNHFSFDSNLDFFRTTHDFRSTCSFDHGLVWLVNESPVQLGGVIEILFHVAWRMFHRNQHEKNRLPYRHPGIIPITDIQCLRQDLGTQNTSSSMYVNMTMEHHRFEQEIRLQLFFFPLS